MNQAIETLRTTATNPATTLARREAAISQLRAIAADAKDNRASDAAAVLRDLPPSTDDGQAKQTEPVRISGCISEKADAELLEALTKYPVGGTPDEPRSSEVQILYDDLLTCIYSEQHEPRILANRKLVYQTSRHALVREKAFWAIAAMAFAGDYPRGQKQALAFVQKERPTYSGEDFITSPYRPMVPTLAA